ncbi:hypothetical protein JX265_011611 [Neoarthrinium moseri]|uniref:Uncharacterized protein n=1 Tax=Neoarthrinium moseri TaxID=1658444 RepID=A0A9P9WC18_9PEZI|nr:uncharacterized protein JN550_011938 [Neoarthrinium moseri]KAI1845501.1 hypothetical protein JX266_008359 [Neoarthrinium moseri]KAI1856364.1 hypothetical protein JX265_011611 [Neoarthrinium moseri]KAI1859630.1 hypothetical protein JN550_011938 [Neoarthrinium moseri]
MTNSDKEIVLVTGGNTGIGLEVVRKLLRDHGDKFHVIIGCRTVSKGEEAAQSLKQDGCTGVETVQLDVTNEESLAAAAKAIEERHGRLDVLHANAGIALDLNNPDRSVVPMSKLIMQTMETNVAGQAATVENFEFLLRKADNPRVIFMSTGAGSFEFISDHKGLVLTWPSYCVSKAALNMLMVYYFHKFPNWKVNACCPGFRATNLNNFGQGSGGAKPGPVDEGAINAVRLSLLGKDGESGTYTQLEGTDGWRTVGW